MDDLDFRKWLKEYGYTYEEYEGLSAAEKEQIERRFKAESRSNAFKSVGEGLQSCGCILMLLPILGILIVFIWVLLAS